MIQRRAVVPLSPGDIPVVTGTNGTTNGTNGTNGNHSTTPGAGDPRKRRRKKKLSRNRRPSQMIEDWMAIIVAILFLFGMVYWFMGKMISIWHGSTSYDNNENIAVFDDPSSSVHNQNHNNHGSKSQHHGRHGRKKQRMLDSTPDVDPMPFNDLYHMPESHELVGDRSDRYAKLRKLYDQVLPVDTTRSHEAVLKLRSTQQASKYQVVPITQEEIKNNNNNNQHSNQKLQPYDIYNCPETPPPGYPFAWPIMTVLENWNPNDIIVPEMIHQGLCVFQYENDYEKAMIYRKAEVPFIVQGDPSVERAVERWNYPGYMEELLDSVMHRAEFSHNNHFMYHLPVKKGRRRNKQKQKFQSKHGINAPFADAPKDYKPPTEMIRMTYLDWLSHANITHPEDPNVAAPDQDHWYFRLIGCGLTGNTGDCDKGSSEYLFDELTFFQPVNNLYMAKGAAQKGIHCRFGMKGVIAENHFDGSRNAIVVLGGSRRYILSHPDQCENLCLYPQGHPSARHSQVDYSDPDLDTFPQFAHANANEVVMQPGDVLYLPTNWFHYIVSLELNYQCNSRSGIGYEYEDIMNECGF